MEHEQELRNLLVRSAAGLNVKISEQQIGQFLCYLAELVRWNQSINLTGITNPEEIVIKHFIDSLLGLAATDLCQGAVLVDVGTGAGFPGIPMKLMRSDLRLRLIEANHKKCAFLASVVGRLKLSDVTIFQGTVQAYCKTEPAPVDVLTLRALKFSEVAHEASILVKKGGIVLLYRTTKGKFPEAGTHFHLLSERSFTLPGNSGERVIAVLERRKEMFHVEHTHG